MKYIVEITEQENGYCFTGEWDNDFLPEGYIEAESEIEAEDFARAYLKENGEDPEKFLYRIRVKEEI